MAPAGNGAPSTLPSRPDAGAIATFVALFGIAAAAWAFLLVDGSMRGTDPPAMPATGKPRTFLDPVAGVTFVGAWAVMMAAMMLPSTAPMVAVYRKVSGGSEGRRAVQLAVLVSAYVVAWAAFGLGVYVVQESVAFVAGSSPTAGAAWPFAVSAIVLAAGVYQLTRLKDVCLRQCRSPFSFVMERWRPGLRGAMDLGLRHGVYCTGCCWGLMAVLVAAGAMGLEWAALIAVAVFAEKILPRGRTVARLVGGLLIGLGIAIAVRPDLVSRVQM